MKLESSPSGRSSLGQPDQEHRAERAAEDRAAAAQHGRDDDLHAEGEIDDGVDGGGSEVKDQECAGEAENKALIHEGDELVLGDVEAERAA